MTFSEVLAHLLNSAIAVQSARQRRALGKEVSVSVSVEHSPQLPEEDAFRQYAATLSPAQVYMATMVMYAGRGDFDPSFDILERYAQMSDTFQSPDLAISQMLEKYDLPQFRT